MSQELFMPFGLKLDLSRGVMEDPDEVVVRKASSMRGMYVDETALAQLIDSGDPVHYEVFEKNIPEEPGHLRICISKLYPGLIANEYFMTKGHYHVVEGTAEIYLCLAGSGFMLMKTSEGRHVAEPMAPGRMVYVPPFWAHRSINTGNVPLISFCVYPGEAGHNYGDIEKEGFPAVVVKGPTGPEVMEKADRLHE